MAIIAKNTVVFSKKKLETKEPQSRQEEIKARQLEVKEPPKKKEVKEIKARIEPEERVIETPAPSSERGILVHKPSQFMHDMLNEQNKQE